MGWKVDAIEFKKEFGGRFKTASIAREIGITPNSLYASMNPKSRQSLGIERVNLLKERYNLKNSEVFYKAT